MSTASTARCRPRSRAWLRVLVLLLALLVPGAHAQAHALPAVAGVSGTAGTPGEVAEHDVLDTVLRPPARADRRGAVRRALPRPGTPPKPTPCVVRADLTPPAPPRPPYLSHVLRTVVLRC